MQANYWSEKPMDLICVNCGEPWDIDHVVHEEPEGFDRQGGLIRSCPCCAGKTLPPKSRDERHRLEAIKTVAELLGDDVDGCAAMIEDMDYFFDFGKAGK
jgi:hypothetical protein